MADDRHIPGLALPRTLLRIVGFACIVLASLELLFSIVSIADVVTGSTFDEQTPYGVYFFVPFILIVLAVQFGLLFCGHQLMRCRTNVRHVLTALSLAPIAFLVVLIVLSEVTDAHIWGSAFRATAVGPGMMKLQLVIFFPLWAPAIVYWAHRRLSATKTEREKSGLCIHCGYDLRGTNGKCPECGLG